VGVAVPGAARKGAGETNGGAAPLEPPIPTQSPFASHTLAHSHNIHSHTVYIMQFQIRLGFKARDRSYTYRSGG